MSSRRAKKPDIGAWVLSFEVSAGMRLLAAACQRRLEDERMMHGGCTPHTADQLTTPRLRSREASAARIDRLVTALACSGVASGGRERLAIWPTTSSSCLHQRTKSPAVSSVASRMSASCAPSHHAWTTQIGRAHV